MNKRLLTLSLIGVLSMGLTSCSDVTRKKVDGKQVIMTVGGTNYTADDLLAEYSTSSSGVSTYYDAIYDVLIRNAQAITSSMETTVDNKIDTFVKEVKQNAASNGKTYRAQLSDSLESQGLESLSELRKVYMLDAQKTQYEDDWYENNMESLTKEYLSEKTPYHIKHILVNTSDAGTSLYDGKISEDEALKLSNTIARLASGDESFGQIAQQASDDSSSAELYGSVGIMDQDTSFVSEFKYGIYAYDALFDTHTGDISNEERAAKLNIPDKVLDDSGDDDKNLGSITSIDVKSALSSIEEIPYKVVNDLEKYADKTSTVDNLVYVPQKDDSHYKDGYSNNVGQTITESYYPRNILFNNYFNDHGLYVITEDETFTGDADKSNFAYVDSLSPLFDGKKVLTDGNGNPILITRAGSGDSYQGVHFMVIEQSPFWYDSNKLGNTIFEDAAPDSVEDYLLNYYSTDVPSSSSTDVSKDQRYVTFVKTSRTTYQERADDIEDTVKGFDSNVSYKIFEDLLYEDATAENPVVKSNITIDPTILASIQDLIASKRESTEVSTSETTLSSWTSYIELLTLQDAEKAVKQLSLDYINLYDADYVVPTNN
jgi:hypothetical protein